jgi:hypothetical protein
MSETVLTTILVSGPFSAVVIWLFVLAAVHRSRHSIEGTIKICPTCQRLWPGAP